MAINYAKVLSTLRKGQGYEGDDTLESVKTFVAEKGIVLTDGDGDDAPPIDLDVLHADHVKPKTRLAVDDTPIPGIPARKSSTSGVARINSSAAVHSKASTRTGVAKKHYETIARTAGVGIFKNQVCFADADVAEFMGAALRLGYATRNHVNAQYSQRDNDMEIIEKAGSEFNPSTGGVLVPIEYDPTLIYLKERYGVTRKVANVVPMARDTKDAPRVTGIQAMSPVGELATMTPGDDNFDLVGLAVKKWGRLAQFPNELLDDSAISVADVFARTAIEAQTKAEDQTYFLGDGTAAYNNDVGLANALPTAAYVAASGNAWSAIVEGDINKVIGSVENTGIDTLPILCSRQFYAQVLQPMYTTSGRGFQEEFGSMFGLVEGQGAVWKGFPVIFTQVLPTVSASASKCMYFGNFAAASMLGDRRDLTIATSEHFYFSSDAFAVRAISRFTVNVHGDGRASTYGPIACLKTT